MRQGNNVAIGDCSFTQAAFDQSASIVQRSLVLLKGELGRTGKQDLHDGGSGCPGPRPEHCLVERRVAPAQKIQADVDERLLYNLAALLCYIGRSLGGGQEDQADRQAGGIGESNLLPLKFL